MSSETLTDIGINDCPSMGNDLSGCVNDANDWKEGEEIGGHFSIGESCVSQVSRCIAQKIVRYKKLKSNNIMKKSNL